MDTQVTHQNRAVGA